MEQRDRLSSAAVAAEASISESADSRSSSFLSTVASSSSTPSKVLSDKLHSLDQQWSAVKAQSPIIIKKRKKPTVRGRTKTPVETTNNNNCIGISTTDNSSKDINKQPLASTGIESITGGGHANVMPSNNNPPSLGRHDDDDDDGDSSSVGASTISTLSSTESVFDRLYRQGIRSPKVSSSTNTNSAAAAAGGGSYVSASTSLSLSKTIYTSPTIVRRTPNLKDRLGAYKSSVTTTTTTDTRSLGRYGDYTPRRRTRDGTVDGLGNDAASAVSSPAGMGLERTTSLPNSSSVFSRLYRNEKRSEKLWHKPPAFVPKLSKSPINVSGSQTRRGQTHEERERTPVRLECLLEDPLPPSATTLEEDIEVIKELGRQLGADECSPTVAGSSVSTLVIDRDNNLGSSPDQSPQVAKFLTGTYTTSVDDEISVLEAVGKQLETMEANQDRFLYHRGGTNNTNNSNRNNLETNDSIPDPTKKANTTIPITLHNRASLSLSDDTNTDSTGTGTHGFFTLDQSVRSYFFAERIDRLSTPLRRRLRTTSQINSSTLQSVKVSPYEKVPYGNEDELMMTPRRIRHSSSITIQRSWRLHLDELRLASSIVQSFKSSFVFSQDGNTNNTFITRKRALRKAIKVVGCWWILEGLHKEDDWVTIAWENEVRVDNTMIQVHLNAEVPYIQSDSHWNDRKLAVLIVKAALIKTLRGELAAERVARWYREYKGKHKIVEENQELAHSRPVGAVENALDEDPVNETALVIEESGRTEIDVAPSPSNSDISFDLRQEVMEEIVSPINLSEGTKSQIETTAAITIQTWLRLTVLKSAIKERPATRRQLHAVLSPNGLSAGPKLGSTDEFDAARNILFSSIVSARLSKTNFSWLEQAENSEVDFIAQRAAALAIHNIVRVYLVGLTKYRSKKKATMIQALYRGYFVRKQFEARHFAAVVIQFAWSNSRYHKFKVRCAIIIQRFWRMIYCSRRYNMINFCVLLLQAACRGAIAKHRFARLRNSAIMIQRNWRSRLLKKQYAMLLSTVRALQYKYQRKRLVAQFHVEWRSSISIQKQWRKHEVHTALRDLRNATICLQSYVRRNQNRKIFLDARRKSLTIQTYWRQCRGRVAYRKQLSAAVCVQSSWRRFSAVERYKTQKECALQVQRCYRGYRCRVLNLRYEESAASLQPWFRAILARKRVRIMQMCAIEIQRVWRSKIASKELQRLSWKKSNQSSTVIQTRWRSASVRRRYCRTLFAIITIQSAVRRMAAVNSYYDILECKRGRLELQAIIFMQRICRGHKVRTQLVKSHSSAKRIQAIWRRRNALSQYAATLSFVVMIQSLWRGKLCRSNLSRQQGASEDLQRFSRGFLARVELDRRKWKRAQDSAVLIQSHWRTSAARTHFHRTRRATICLQSAFRMVLANDYCLFVRLNEQLKTQKSAAFRISRAYKSYKARLLVWKTVESAKKVQAHWRSKTTQQEFRTAKFAIVAVQSLSRGVLTRNCMLKHHAAARKLQHFWRRALTRVARRIELKRITAFVTMIQRAWRGGNARGKLHVLRVSATLIQSARRRVLARRTFTRCQQSLKIKVDAAERVQKWWKHVTIQKLKHAAHAATLIQMQWRAARAREHYCYIRTSAIVIQSVIRRSLAMRTRNALVLLIVEQRLKIDAAIRIQTTYRKYVFIQARRYQKAKMASVVVQSAWRASRSRSLYSLSRGYIIIIQAFWRGALTRASWRFVRFLRQDRAILDDAARKIQVAFHVYKMELAALEMKSLVVLLQRGVRGQLVRSAVRYALLHMNSAFRPTGAISYDRLAVDQEQGLSAVIAWDRAAAQARVVAATVIQSFVRRMIVRNKMYRDFGVVFEASYLIAQMPFEQEQAVLVVQRKFRLWYQRRRLCFVILIQKIARGWIHRMRYHLIVSKVQSNLADAALQIQTFERRRRCRSSYSQKRRSSILIQRCLRKIHSRRLSSIVQDETSTKESKLLSWRKIDEHIKAVKIQSVMRSVMARRFAEERKRVKELHEQQARTQIFELTERAGRSLVEDLLHGRQLARGPCHARLVHRVTATISESNTTSDVTPVISYQEIPLPPGRPKDTSATELIKIPGETSAITTPVRCNKATLGSPLSESETVEVKKVNALPARVLIWQLDADDDSRNNEHEQGVKEILATQPTVLLDRVRSDLRTSPNNSHHSPGNVEPGYSPSAACVSQETEDNSSSFATTAESVNKNFTFGGMGPLPSPIREKKTDWDWTDEW